MDKYFNVYYIVCIIWCLAFLGMILYLNFNCSVPYTPKFKEKIYPKIPSNLNPGELSNLMYKNISPNVFTATIMFLVKKGVLTLKRTKVDFILILNDLDINLSPSQNLVIMILIEKIGDGKQVTFKQIEEYCKSSHNSTEFLSDYQLWKKMMIKESNKKTFYEEKTEYNQVMLLRVTGFALFLLNIILGFHSLIGYFIVIPAYFIVLYFYKIYKRTETANEEYHKWLAFKYYLNHIDEYFYEPENIGSYIIYGLVLKIPNLEQKLTDFHCVEKLNDMINHNVILSSLKGNRGIKF